MTVRVTAEADSRQGPGHAVIRVEGAQVAPDGVRFLIRRPGYREDSLGPGGWQAAEAHLTPDAAYVAHGVLTLHVGPDVVAHMEPGMNVAFTLVLPDGTMLDGRLAWPAIPGPIGGAGARRGRLVATQRVAHEPAPMRTGGALVGDVAPPSPPPPAARPVVVAPPAPEPAPEPVTPVLAATEPEPEELHGPDLEPELSAPDAADGEGPRIDLRAERDRAETSRERRAPWGGRIALTASIAVLLLAGAAAASVYLGRDQICASESVGPLAGEWGLCPAQVVAAATEPEPVPPPAVAPGTDDRGGWNLNPLDWLGPLQPSVAERGGDAGGDGGSETGEAGAETGETPSPESQRALARLFLEGQPTPEEAFARANALREEGQVEAAFLIYRYAAELDHPEAAVAVAGMYDPQTYSPETSPLPRPNPVVARRWYEAAVGAGDTEALLRLARMLMAQNQDEEARAVLRRAEEAGLGEAASQLLEELQ
jgi:TPR repeat protein